MGKPEIKPQALIIDSDIDASKITTEAVVQCGYDPVVLSDPQALSRTMELKFARTRPALILIDVSLPRMSGFEMARRLLVEHKGHKIPVFLTSKYESGEDRVEAASIGVQFVLVKPVGVTALRQAIERLRMRDLKAEIGNLVLAARHR